MARKKKEQAKYECIFPCTIHIEGPDGTIEHLCKPVDDAADESECYLSVEAGEIVPMHFKPINAQAEEDREDQMSEPERFCETEKDIILIAEIMVKEGLFKHEFGKDGKIVKSNTEVAKDAVRATLGDKADQIVEEGRDVERESAIRKLLELGKDPKEQRSAIGAILKKASIKYFPGADPEALAAIVYDEDLFKG